MVNKTEIIQNMSDQLNSVAASTGFMVLALATASGSIQMPQHEEKRAVLAARPTEAIHADNAHGTVNLRHEREEPAPHYTSYGANQRTPARSSK